MAKSTIKSTTAISNLTARSSILTIAIFLILLSLVHILKPEIDPSWRVISEYEIGRFGWIMQIAFFSFALGSLSLFIALKSQLRTLVGRIGLGLLFITVIGITIGAIFPSDPITTPRDSYSMAGSMHNFGGLLSVLMFPFVATFISWGLARSNKVQMNILLFLFAVVIIVWLSLVGYFAAYYTSGAAGPGPDALIGWPNRVFIVAYCTWLILVASQISKMRSLRK